MIARVIAGTAFQSKLFKALTDAGLKPERLLRQYQPYTATEEIECLIVDHEQGALTVWCDPTGKITRGPEPGFGREPETDE